MAVTVQNAYLELPNRLGTWLTSSPIFSRNGFTTPKVGFKSSVRTDRSLTTRYENSVTGQFSQVNQKISDQVDSIDSIIPLYSRELLQDLDQKEHRLTCRMLPSDEANIYFIRNLFNSNTGRYHGIFIIAVDLEKWLDYCVKGLDPSWFICLYDEEINLCSDPRMAQTSLELQAELEKSSTAFVSFRELTLCSDAYFTAAQRLDRIRLTAAVAVPKKVLFQDLNDTLKTYILMLACTVLAGLLAAVIISRAVTRPIDRMICHINQISAGESDSLPPMKMYREFRVWADAFNRMLKQLDIYCNDNFQKQLLLKSSEIRALQSQMNPHFLFNVLNTIAWKAQISDNEEIYQMIISLGELLKKKYAVQGEGLCAPCPGDRVCEVLCLPAADAF